MSITSAPAPVASGIEPQDRGAAAWELVRTVRWAAGQFMPYVDDAAAGVMNLYTEDELARDDPSLARALTVMVGVLTNMQVASDILGWLETSTRAMGITPLPPAARSTTLSVD